jgi:hypothetical protein
MTELEKAAKEWCEARRAFLAVPPVSSDPKERFPQAIWIRLANAEYSLMKLAERL